MTENVIVKLVSLPSHVMGAASVIRTVWSSVELVVFIIVEGMFRETFSSVFGTKLQRDANLSETD